MQFAKDALVQSFFDANGQTYQLDMQVYITNQNEGVLQIKKFRKGVKVVVDCPFFIIMNAEQELVYKFPDDQLLLRATTKDLDNLKRLFKQNDVMLLKFCPENLKF